jgi:anthranilate phosphoribosyltransferase
MQELLPLLHSKQDLSPEQARAAALAIAHPEVSPELKEAFLEALHLKGECAAEIAAFAQALLELSVDPQIPSSALPGPTLDVCGTGGDKLELFNVSTTAMFVLAAGGATVLKHGNRAITSKCGGADVLESLGVRIELPPQELRECVKRHGLGFLFAPAYHPAFRVIAPIRRALATRSIPTIFNLLGPVLNPARPAHQLVGVYSKKLLPCYAEVLARLGRKTAWAVHGNGADELTLAGPSAAIALQEGRLCPLEIHPESLGLPNAPVEALRGGDREENARILIAILSNEMRGPKSDVVALNAAAGFVICGLSASLPEGLDRARELIASGKALAKLRALQSF